MDANTIKASVNYQNYFRFIKDLTWTYHSESKQYRQTIYDHFSSDLNIYEGYFNNDTLSFSNSEIEFRTLMDKKFQQFRFIALTDNTFTIEFLTSGDDGETWQAKEKWHFIKL